MVAPVKRSPTTTVAKPAVVVPPTKIVKFLQKTWGPNGEVWLQGETGVVPTTLAAKLLAKGVACESNNI